jgi:hypothetical protein
VPIEIYKEVLFLLSPDDVISTCHTNKYAKEICNEEFYHHYIILNFDSQRYGLHEWSDHVLELFSNLQINTWEELLNLLSFSRPILLKIYNGDLTAENVENMEHVLSTFINVSNKDTYINLIEKIDSIVDQIPKNEQFYRTLIRGSTECFEWKLNRGTGRNRKLITMKLREIEGAQFNNKCPRLKSNSLSYDVNIPLYNIEIQGEPLINNKIEITIIYS